MQWHIAVKRNTNSALFAAVGPDCGGDSIRDAVPSGDITAILDKVDSEGGLPKTILYSLNPTACPALATIAGSFRGVICGAAWWFCDHKKGIIEQIETIAQVGDLSTFLGMLTDSRSFLSYARHDYFRRIFCSVLGGWIEDGEFPEDETAYALTAGVFHDNLEELIRG